jgi:hypothetical protein
MAYGLLDDQLKLDPAMLEFLQRQQGQAPAPPPAPTMPPPPPSGPPPMRTPLSDLDPKIIDFLKQHDAEAKDYNDRRDLNEGVGRSMNYFMKKPVAAGFPPPKVDDEMQKFLIHQSTLRNYGAMNDPERQPPTEEHIQRAIAAGVPENFARGAPTLRVLEGAYARATTAAKPDAPVEWQAVPSANVMVNKRDPTQQVPLPKPDPKLAITSGGASRGAEPDYSEETIRRWREQWDATGELPKGITPRFSPKTVERITNAKPDGTPRPLSEARATYGADSKSLAKQQQLLDLTKSWEETGKANLDNLKSIAGKLVNSGSPLLNKPLRAIYASAAGDPTVIAFRAAHAAVVNEYAKILSGSMGSAGVTEGARHEAEAMLPLDSTPEQIAAAAGVLETDAGNRLSALHRQTETTRARTAGKTGASEESSPATSAPVRKFTRGPDGKLTEVKP